MGSPDKEKKLTFRDLLEQQRTWEDYSDFCSQISGVISEEVKENAKREAKLIEDIKKDPAFKNLKIKNVEPQLKQAERLLTEGNVVGIDATMAKYHFLSGTRCQIGVVAANYIGDQIRHSFFISQANIHEDVGDALERIQRRAETDDQLSDMHMRGLMFYREREAGLNPKFGGKYLLYHGPLLPFELMSGLGRLRALDTTLDLLKRLVSSRRCISIISTPSFKDYTYLGLALENNQYLSGENYTLGHHLANTADFLAMEKKWRAEEYEKAKNFINDYAGQIYIGVIKISDRPYVFHAHKDIFDLAAAIIARDSMFQREKGFPLLIDYADSMCSEYFSASEFNKMVDWELAKSGDYLRESGERRMRMK
jgi:hypothetical protein